jgi:hypothetical protein
MRLLAAAAFLATSVSIASSQNVPELFDRPGGLVPDKKTAVAIAEAVLFKIYGEKTIRDQRPYVIRLARGKWTIDGAPPPHGFVGGSFHIVIRQRDAQILEIGHGV